MLVTISKEIWYTDKRNKKIYQNATVSHMNNRRVEAPCTVILAATNVIVFFLLTSQGMTEDGRFLLDHGAMFVPMIQEEGEYYRFLTSMFLHFGFEHLMNNMITLAVIGWNLEIEIGKFRFLLIYILSGLGGNLLSAVYDVWTGEYAVSAGASGAIFGIIGALLYVVMRNRGRIRDISGKGIVFMIVISLYYGITSGGVDNMAHIGGLMTGFVLSVLLYRKNDHKGRAFAGR